MVDASHSPEDLVKCSGPSGAMLAMQWNYAPDSVNSTRAVTYLEDNASMRVVTAKLRRSPDAMLNNVYPSKMYFKKCLLPRNWRPGVQCSLLPEDRRV